MFGHLEPPDETILGSNPLKIFLKRVNTHTLFQFRRKKKEYIKCLENRVAVLENQNKALIEELKSLKELYTGGEYRINNNLDTLTESGAV